METKISNLIEWLEEMKAKYGDIDVDTWKRGVEDSFIPGIDIFYDEPRNRLLMAD